jgi:RNA polymerase sigma-70 factor (ECF subfamily)
MGRHDQTRDESCATLRNFLVSHYDDLKHRLTRHLGCADLASDSLHDTWVCLERRIPAGEVSNPGAYVFRMACYAAVDRMRNDRMHHFGEDTLALNELADRAPGPAEIIESRSNLDALHRLMTRLPQRQRDIFLSVGIHEQPQKELAVRHGISLRMVERELQLARGYCASARSNPASCTIHPHC